MAKSPTVHASQMILVWPLEDILIEGRIGDCTATVINSFGSRHTTSVCVHSASDPHLSGPGL